MDQHTIPEQETTKTLEEINQLLENSPDDPELYFQRGVYYYEREEFEPALQDFYQAVNIDDTYIDAYINIAYILIKQEKYERAITVLSKIIEADQTDAEYYSIRGTVYYLLNKNNKALQDYNMALTLDTENADLYCDRAELLAELQRYEEAIPDYNKAIELDSSNAKYYNSRGHTYFLLSNHKEALTDFNKAITLQPDCAQYYYSRGGNFLIMDNIPEGLADINKAIQLDNTEGRFFLARALVYYKKQEYPKALQDYETAYRLCEAAKNNASMKLAREGIDKIKGLQSKASKQNKRVKQLMDEIDKAKIENDILETRKDFNKFIEEKKEGYPVSTPEFTVLRRWNSYTPIIADNYHLSKGGGYFFKTNDFGIVIDPGFNFIDNFKTAGFQFWEIDHVFITHAHNDHTSDIESILTLLHKYNELILGEFDTPLEGTIMHEVLNNYPEKADDSNRAHIEKLAKEKLMASPRRKRIRFYMTISTFRKYTNLFELYATCDYDIDIIKTNEAIRLLDPNNPANSDYGKLLKTETIFAKHNDIMSDRDSIGFLFQYNDFILIYTGDTGFDVNIETQYKKLYKRFRNKKIVLLAHLGGFKEYEKKYDASKNNQENSKTFYKNHLGRLGLAKLVEILKPHICVISEFGEEFRTTRCTLTDIFQKVYTETRFFAADIGFCINAENKIEVIDCVNSNLPKSFAEPQLVKVHERTMDASLHYYKDGLDCVRLSESLAVQYKSDI